MPHTPLFRLIMPLCATSAVFCLVLSTNAGAAQNDRNRISLFAGRCGSDVQTVSGETFVDARFAPVRRLRAHESPRYGTWPYDYETEDWRYPENEYVYDRDDRTARIHFVTTMRRPTSDEDLPPYLWHVLSVPTLNDTRAGFIARHEEFRKRVGGVWSDEEYEHLMESTAKADDLRTILFYVNRKLGEGMIARIRQIWTDTFYRAMSHLVIPTHGLASNSHTHTFVYHDSPQAAVDINTDVGDRRNSSRRISAWGTAFGFALDASGNCLASASIEIR